MFSNILHKSFNVGDKIFHVFCDMQINTGNLKDFGADVIKFATELEEEAKKKEEEQNEKETNEVASETNEGRCEGCC